MGAILYPPDGMTWEEWMCLLMCGEPDVDTDEDTDDDEDETFND